MGKAREANKNISGKDLSGTVTSDDLLGKDVIDADGKIIGVISGIGDDEREADGITDKNVPKVVLAWRDRESR